MENHFLKLAPVVDGQNRPVWSVLIPTYNCAEYLKEALTSVLAQDPGKDKMEIIVIDDHSTQDDPESVVRAIGKGRVEFIRQSRNVGKVKNYETGLMRSRGGIIHQLHGDDMVRPGFYSTMESLLNKNPQASAAFSRTIYINERSEWDGMTGIIQEKHGIVDNMLDLLYVQQVIQTPSMVVKREVYETIGAFDRRLNAMEDWEMWTRIANNYAIATSNQVLAEYRAHNNNATLETFMDGSALKIHETLFKILDSYVPESIKSNLNSSRNKHQAKFLFQSLLQHKSKLPSGVIWKMKRRAFSLDPSLKTLIQLILN